MLGLTFSSKLDWGSLLHYLYCQLSKTAMEFLSSAVALYLYKSTIRPCMEQCCHVWLVLLLASWNYQISYKSRYAGLLVLHLLLPSLNPLAHRCSCSSETGIGDKKLSVELYEDLTLRKYGKKRTKSWTKTRTTRLHYVQLTIACLQPSTT